MGNTNTSNTHVIDSPFLYIPYIKACNVLATCVQRVWGQIHLVVAKIMKKVSRKLKWIEGMKKDLNQFLEFQLTHSNSNSSFFFFSPIPFQFLFQELELELIPIPIAELTPSLADRALAI